MPTSSWRVVLSTHNPLLTCGNAVSVNVEQFVMRVVVIFSNQDYACNETPFPPIGAAGVVTSGKDEYGEYDVEFDD